MTDINSTLITLLESPIIQNMERIFGALSIAVGGIFGLYMILIFLRWKESRDVRRLLTEIRDNIKILTKKKK